MTVASRVGLIWNTCQHKHPIIEAHRPRTKVGA